MDGIDVIEAPAQTLARAIRQAIQAADHLSVVTAAHSEALLSRLREVRGSVSGGAFDDARIALQATA